MLEGLAFLLHTFAREGNVTTGLPGCAMGDPPEPDRLTPGDQLLLLALKAPPRNTGVTQGQMLPIAIDGEDPVPRNKQSGAGLRSDARTSFHANPLLIHDNPLEALIDLIEWIRHSHWSEQRTKHRENDI